MDEVKKGKISISQQQFIQMHNDLINEFNNELFDLLQGEKSAKKASRDFWNSTRLLMNHHLNTFEIYKWKKRDI